MTRLCLTCKETKDVGLFVAQAKATQCKACYNTKRALWREKNREKTRAYANERYATDAGGVKTKRRQYHHHHQEEMSKKHRVYSQRPEAKERRRVRMAEKLSETAFRLEARMRCRIHTALRDQGMSKTTRTAQMLGCSGHELARYLESQMRPGMTWENHTIRGWHIDHIMPCNHFDLTDPVQQHMCFHWSNLRPMWGKENIAKHCHITEPNRRWDATLDRWLSQ